MLLDDLGERGLIAALEERGLAGPIGDDTAVLDDGFIATVDTMVEDVHFRHAWTSWLDLGYKAAAVNLSDLAAAAATPSALLVSLAIASTTPVDAVFELYEGLNQHAVPIRGGDTVAAPLTVISVTALGRSDRVPGRGGARAGDVAVVTGPLGGAAAAWRALEQGDALPDALARAYRRPTPRLEEGRRLGAVATAMADISDGLAIDAAHIAARSGCRIELDAEAIPVPAELKDVGDELFWTMGDDYELLATVPAAAAAELGFAVIGRCTSGTGAEITRAGERLDAGGWEHFRAHQ